MKYKRFYRTTIVQINYICSVQISNTMATINFLYRSTKDKANLHLRLLYRFNDIDFVFSRIVRINAADEYGNCTCYTCDCIPKHWSLMQCGHFISRKEMATRWDFRNVRVQDKSCNEGKHGNLEVFRQRLEEEYPGLPDQLREISQQPYSYGISELKQLLTDLRAKLRIAEARFNPKSSTN